MLATARFSEDSLYKSGVVNRTNLKVMANEGTLVRTHCCRHKCFPFARARNICCGYKFYVRDTNVSDFVQKHFVSATNVSQFARARKRHEQQCFRNNVSSFASTLTKNQLNSMEPNRQDCCSIDSAVIAHNQAGIFRLSSVNRTG